MNEGINNLCNTIAGVIKAAVVLVVLFALGYGALIGYVYYRETHKANQPAVLVPDYSTYQPFLSTVDVAPVAPPRKHAPPITPKEYAWATQRVDLVRDCTLPTSSPKVGSVELGERVEVLGLEDCGIPVKTTAGVVGWQAFSTQFTEVPPKPTDLSVVAQLGEPSKTEDKTTVYYEAFCSDTKQHVGYVYVVSPRLLDIVSTYAKADKGSVVFSGDYQTATDAHVAANHAALDALTTECRRKP
jgi:hypothetical protein